MGGTVVGRKLLGVGKRKVEAERGSGSFGGSSFTAAHSRRYLVDTSDGATPLGLWW